MFVNTLGSHLKTANYEIRKPSTGRETLFRCKFWADVSYFLPCVINLSGNIYFLLRVEESCCEKKTACQSWTLLLVFHQTRNFDSNQANQPISALHFFNPQQMFLLRDKLITQGETQGEKRETSTQTSTQNLPSSSSSSSSFTTKQYCATSRELLYLVFRRFYRNTIFYQSAHVVS